MVRTVYFVRHGEMALNREENWNLIIKTGINGPLTPRGIGEVEALGKTLSGIEFTECFTSDFIRAHDTAKIILKHSSHPTPIIQVDLRVRERDAGEWVEKTPLEMYMASKAAGMYPHCLPAKEGESFEQVIQRAKDFFQNEVCKETEGEVLVTSHGAWLASLLEHIATCEEYEVEGDFEVNRARAPAPTTGLTKIIVGPKKDGKRRMNFLSLHDQTHLQGITLPD